jgi:hypothetical protein
LPTSSNGDCDDGSIPLGCEGHAGHPAAADGEDGFLMALTSRWGSHPLYLSHPSRPFDSLGDGNGIVVPLGRGHADRSGQVLGMVAGGGEYDPPLSGDVLVNISPTQVDSR